LDQFDQLHLPSTYDYIAGPEARAFFFMGALAVRHGKGLVPIRKRSKLPRSTLFQSYEKEYGPDYLFVHEDAIPEGGRTLIFDDVLATGGTVGACGSLIKRLRAELVGYGFLLELTDLKGREKLGNSLIHSVLSY
jgi:adenine phosphoribosyltransferase